MTALTLPPISSAARAAIDDAAADASRALRYAAGAVAISFVGNVVHLVGEVASVADLATAHGAAVAAEALGGPSLVFICSHLLMHADRGRRIERLPLWAGFVAGAALSAVHLWSVAFAVLSVGLLAEIHELAPYLASGLLPVGVEGAAIGSIQQAARFRSERDRLAADIVAAEAARVEAEDQARRDADAEVRRRVEVERAEAERLTAEAEAEERRIAAETERERQLLVDRQKAVRAVGKARKGTGRARSKVDTEADIAVYLAAHAAARGGKGPTAKQVAQGLGMSERNVLRADAWKNRTAAPTPTNAADGGGGEGQGDERNDEEGGGVAAIANGTTPNELEAV